MTSYRIVKPEASVKARLHQFESAVASADHFSKHPEQLRKKRAKGSSSSVGSFDEENDNGNLDFADFVRTFTLGSTADVSEKDALLEAFKILDCDEDGFITLADLREAMGGFDDDEEDDNQMTDEDLIDMIAAADDKGNGRINFDSFVRILQPNNKHNNNPNGTSQGHKSKAKR